METKTENDVEHFKQAVQSEGKIVNLNNNSCKANKNKFQFKPKRERFLKSRTCSYFYSKGYCKFGDDCKYKHFNKKNDGNHIPREQSTSFTKNVFKSKITVKKDSLQDRKLETSSKQMLTGENLIKEENCEHHHSVENCSNEISNFELLSLSQRIPTKAFSASNRQPRKQNKPMCYYYKKGFCFKGDSCKYYHIRSSLSTTAVEVPDTTKDTDDSLVLLPSEDRKETLLKENSVAKKPVFVSHKSLNIHDLSSLTSETAYELRSTEISQLKKRFPHLETIIENQTFSIIFQPSDPDWAFDVKSLKLQVNFPEKYPIEKCKITVIRSADNIPGLLIKFLNKAICEWVDKKFEENNAVRKTELMFRMFLRWFDKNLEELFITGLKQVKQDLKAKEDGIEFIPVEDLFSSPEKDTVVESIDRNIATQDTSQLEEQTLNSNEKNSDHTANQSNKLFHYGENNGMKMVFSGLELTEGAAAFICTKISVTLQCCRCKTSFNMKSVPKKNNNYVCSKCSKNVGFTFDPSTVHQFSSVLGYLHLLDCAAVDMNLIECHFLVDCLNCSKQVPVDGIHYGQKHKMWCTFCNEKMMISIGSVKFQAAKLASLSDAKYLPAKKMEKKVKDPVVKEGEPLPNFGACKHYKKSFRWLRFPCCGRLYPCDECHNENETDHEMKYASRMICGFCAKEQPYSREKPCFLCSQNLTKKSGSHWEGGKGCRNKIQMSREDKQKYSGVSKTVSKKAQTAKMKKKH